jgi:hypothetical protein
VRVGEFSSFAVGSSAGVFETSAFWRLHALRSSIESERRMNDFIKKQKK